MPLEYLFGYSCGAYVHVYIEVTPRTHVRITVVIDESLKKNFAADFAAVRL